MGQFFFSLSFVLKICILSSSIGDYSKAYRTETHILSILFLFRLKIKGGDMGGWVRGGGGGGGEVENI